MATTPYVSPLNGGIISAANVNVEQTGAALATASLISQRAGFNPWIPFVTAGAVTVAPLVNGNPGGASWNFTSTAAGQAGFTLGPLIPINTARGYCGHGWAALVSGTGTVCIGYVAYGQTGNQLVGNDGTWGFFIAKNAAPGAGTNYTGYISGEGTALTTFPVGTKYIQLFILLGVGSTGAWQFSATVPEIWEGAGYDSSNNNYITVGASKSLGIFSGGVDLLNVSSAGLKVPLLAAMLSEIVSGQAIVGANSNKIPWLQVHTFSAVANNVATTIAVNGSGWVFISIPGTVNHQIYGVGGTAAVTPYLTTSTWGTGVPAAGHGSLAVSGSTLQITQNYGSAQNIIVAVVGTGF